MNAHNPLLRLLHHLTDKVITGEADSTDIEILAELFNENREFARIFDENRLQKRCSTLLERGNSPN
jgi:hypothetical protein